MKIAVLGCGAIGGLFLARLSLSSQLDVVGVARHYQEESLRKEGFFINRKGIENKTRVKVKSRLEEPVDLAIFSTKINNLKAVVEKNKNCLGKAAVLSTQNGVSAEKILKDFFPEEKIISSVVMFGATFFSPNKVVLNFDGSLVLGNFFGDSILEAEKTAEVLGRFFQTKISHKIKGAKYLKLLVNLNNCLAAILGKPMQESFADLEIAKLAVEINREAYRVLNKNQIKLADLPGYPKERIKVLIEKPLDEAAAVFSQVMSQLSREPLYGSVLQSIKRGRPSEIDYLNGEIVSLAKTSRQPAPLNEGVVDLVHKVEKDGFLPKEKLIAALKNKRG